jgi:hypothetical protein
MLEPPLSVSQFSLSDGYRWTAARPTALDSRGQYRGLLAPGNLRDLLERVLSTYGCCSGCSIAPERFELAQPIEPLGTAALHCHEPPLPAGSACSPGRPFCVR